MLQQLIFWQPKAKGRTEVFKTVDDWDRELCLSRRESDAARKLLESRGLIEVRRRGCPPKLHYKINYGALEAFLAGLGNQTETAESIRPKRANQLAQNGRVFHKTTTEAAGSTNKQTPAVPASSSFQVPGSTSNPQPVPESADPLGLDQELANEADRLATHPPEKPSRRTAAPTAPASASAESLKELSAETREIIQAGVNGVLAGAAGNPAVPQAIAGAILRHLYADAKGATDPRKRAVVGLCHPWMEIVDRIAVFEQMVKNSYGCPAGDLTEEQWSAILTSEIDQRWPVRTRSDYGALVANADCLGGKHPLVRMLSLGINFDDVREVDAAARLLDRCRRRLIDVKKIMTTGVARPEAEWPPAALCDLSPGKLLIHLFRYWLAQFTPAPTDPNGLPLSRPNTAQATDLAISWAAYNNWHIRLATVIDHDSLGRLLTGAASDYAGRLAGTIRRQLFGDQPVPPIPETPPEPINPKIGVPHPHQASLLDAISYTTVQTPGYEEKLNAVINGDDKILARTARRRLAHLRSTEELRIAEAELKDIWSRPDSDKRLATMLLSPNPLIAKAAKEALELNMSLKPASASATLHGGPDDATGTRAQDQPGPPPPQPPPVSEPVAAEVAVPAPDPAVARAAFLTQLERAFAVRAEYEARDAPACVPEPVPGPGGSIKGIGSPDDLLAILLGAGSAAQLAKRSDTMTGGK